MEKTAQLKTKQEELLEKLRLYKEQKELAKKQSTTGKAKVPASRSTHDVPTKTRVGKIQPDFNHAKDPTRRVLALKQPIHRTSGIQAKSATAISRNAKQNTGRTDKVQSCPVTTQIQIDKTVTPEKAAPIKRLSFTKVKSKQAQENSTPKRKRTSSYTLDEHEASPLIKRPVIKDDNKDDNIPKILKMNNNPELSTVNKTKSTPNRSNSRQQINEQTRTQSKAQHEDRECDAKLSMRKRLELWRQEKDKNKSADRTSRINSSRDRFTAFTKCVSGPANSTTITNGKSAPIVISKTRSSSKQNTHSTIESTEQRRKSHLGHVLTKKVETDNTFQRRKSYAYHLHCDVASKAKQSVPHASKVTNQTSVTINLQQSDLHKRRKSCNFPVVHKSGPSTIDNVLNRRKSYALALQEQVQNKSTAGQHVRKRFKTVPARCLSNTQDTNTKAALLSTRTTAQRRSPRTQKEPSSTVPESKLLSKTIQKSPQKVAECLQVDIKTPEITYSRTPKSRKSMSVRFASPNSPSPQKTAARTMRPATPGHAVKNDHVTAISTPVRLTPLKMEQSMRDKLNTWLEIRGKTPSRFSHMLKFGDDLSSAAVDQKVKGGLSLDELSHQQEALTMEDSAVYTDTSHIEDPLTQKLDAILSECLILLDFDCPTDTVEQWLMQICSNLEGVQQVAKYWICRAKIAQRSGDDNAVISVFEESVRYNAQPPEEVADALKEFVDHMSQKHAKRQSLNNSLAQQLPSTPMFKARDIQEENIFTSSAIKYCYTETTPFFKKLRSKARRSHTTPYAVVTPVRRSTRRSVSTLPVMLQDHNRIIESLDHLSAENMEQALFVPNIALYKDMDESFGSL